MTAPVFVDSNVLVYSQDASRPSKRQRAREWLEALWASQAGRLSFRVLFEFYVVVTRKRQPAMPAPQARAIAEELATWSPVRPSVALARSAWSIEDRYGATWWDALIVAAALESGARFLLTEDMQEGQEFGGVRVLNPFVHTPDEFRR